VNVTGCTRLIGGRGKSCRCRIAGEPVPMIGPDVAQDAQAVEPVNLLVLPQHRSEHVHRFEPVRCESSPQ
jgi:hypothetical protein